MLADPRSDALVSNFAGQWLQVRNLKTIAPNHDEFPDFDDTLREAFQREAELFFESIMREDRNVIDLLTADHTFVNERLAKHYGVPSSTAASSAASRVPNDARRGLAGQGRHADGDVARRSDGSGSPRQVDPRERAGHAAAAAAAQRASAPGEQRHRRRRRCASGWRCTAPARAAPAVTS